MYGKLKHLERMPPIFGGGDMIKTVTFAKTVYADSPAKFEAGTPDIVSVIALGEAVKFVTEDVGIDVIRAYEHELMLKARAALKEVSGVRIIGDALQRPRIRSCL